ncbi:hypothetical protein [Marivirga sp.]|uniref:hypothetical protein n=1 Tax=Marivirga sp. TaxID=2018662 RepID=UPI002D804110|nr:hypothetical protein [Marivirga sp.]HET8860753.1 hypothetical protein [Marivirga sp.]
MSTRVKSPLVVIVLFLWIGFVCAISFMEAWLKFQAPGVTLPIGLSIGRLVFGALNKVEWVFALAILLTSFVKQRGSIKRQNLYFLIPFLILILQSIWLLPELDVRAVQLIEGQVVPPSNLHFYYVGCEVVKVIALVSIGIKQFK